jgi:hypothetical protein
MTHKSIDTIVQVADRNGLNRIDVHKTYEFLETFAQGILGTGYDSEEVHEFAKRNTIGKYDHGKSPTFFLVYDPEVMVGGPRGITLNPPENVAPRHFVYEMELEKMYSPFNIPFAGFKDK